MTEAMVSDWQTRFDRSRSQSIVDIESVEYARVEMPYELPVLYNPVMERYYGNLDRKGNENLDLPRFFQKLGVFSATVGFSKADFIVDGISDDVQIQTAFNMVNANGGGTVYIKAGDYTVDTKCKIYSNTEVFGDGFATRIKLKNNANIGTSNSFINYIFGNNDFSTSNSNIIIRNLQIDGNSTNQSGSQSTNWMFGIGLSNVSNSIVENCWVHDCTASGILVEYGSGQSIVTKNFCYNNGDHGINPNFCRSHICSDNVCYGNASQGIYAEFLSNFSISGNYCYDNLKGLAIIRGCSEGSVINNVCSYNLSHGIVLNGDVDSVSYGVNSGQVFNVLVNNNISSYNGSNGMIVQGAKRCTISYNQIMNNSIINAGLRGIYVVNQDTINSNNNLFVGNYIHQDRIYAAVVTSISGTIPTRFSTYTNNSATWQVILVDISGGIGTIYLRRVSGTNVPDLSGTFTYVSGTGSNFVFSSRVSRVLNTGIEESDSSQNNNYYFNNYFSTNINTPLSIFSINAKNNIGVNPDCVFNQGNITGATTFSRVNGSLITATFTGNVTTTITNGVIPGDELILQLTQGSGGNTISKPSNVKLVGGAFSPSAGAGATDIWRLVWDGTSWNEVSRALNLS